MTESTCLWHVNLVTGDRCSSPRTDVLDAAIAAMRGHVERALGPHGDPVPTLPDYLLKAERLGGDLAAQVGTGERALVTIGVAGVSRDGMRPWRLLHRYAAAFRMPVALPVDAPPKPPWCAVVAQPGLEDDPARHWLVEYERCLAWAWIERNR